MRFDRTGYFTDYFIDFIIVICYNKTETEAENMSKKNVTFADIAEYTGFSKTTISRYFSNPDSVTLENQDKIAHALETLNYKENKLARVMANGKTEIIGVIIPNLYMHYHFHI